MREIEYRSDGGEHVHGVLFEPSGSEPHPVILLLHGWLSSWREFGTYPERLRERGYMALAMDWRGHGESQGPRGLISQERMIADVRHALDLIDAHPAADTGRVVLFGHGTGGGAALGAAACDPRVSAVIAGATPSRLSVARVGNGRIPFRFAPALNRIQKSITRRSLYRPYPVSNSDLYGDPQAAAIEQDWRQHTFPVDATPFLREYDAAAWARDACVPTLVIAAELDRVAPPARVRPIFDALAGDKNWLLVEGSGHAFATDRRQDIALAAILRWLGARFDGNPDRSAGGTTDPCERQTRA